LKSLGVFSQALSLLRYSKDLLPFFLSLEAPPLRRRLTGIVFLPSGQPVSFNLLKDFDPYAFFLRALFCLIVQLPFSALPPFSGFIFARRQPPPMLAEFLLPRLTSPVLCKKSRFRFSLLPFSIFILLSCLRDAATVSPVLMVWSQLMWVPCPSDSTILSFSGFFLIPRERESRAPRS